MNSQIFFTILYIVLILSLISFMIFLIFWLQHDGASCMREPLKYASEKAGQECYCISQYGWFSSP